MNRVADFRCIMRAESRDNIESRKKNAPFKELCKTRKRFQKSEKSRGNKILVAEFCRRDQTRLRLRRS